MAESLLTKVKAKIELRTSHKVSSLLSGRGRSMLKGSGEDFDDLKYYQPGDRISDIDWKATARSGEPLIRQFNEERVRNLCIVADTSGAMAATAADGGSKADALVTAAGLLCAIAHENGDLVSLIAGTPEQPIALPARSSRGHLELLLRTIQQAVNLGGPSADLEWLLENAQRNTRRSSYIMVITDTSGPGPECARVIRRLTTRHDVVIVRIHDADPLGRAETTHEVLDPENPREIFSNARASKAVQAEVDSYLAQREVAIAQMLQSLSIPYATTLGDSTVVDDVIAMLRKQASVHGRR